MLSDEIRNLAKQCFNQTWDFIEKDNRTVEETLRMIDLTFKSKYYWSLVGNQVNFIRSNWQVSRVFAEANMLEASLYYAKSVLDDTLKLNLQDFDLFFAYEANVRVYHLLKDFKHRDLMAKKAEAVVLTIKKDTDKKYCMLELEKIYKL
ncbi:MAG: hypothetical protein WCY80_03485 [Candidatus Izemoplasmatales bacterium]|jgi:hypothetical protein